MPIGLQQGIKIAAFQPPPSGGVTLFPNYNSLTPGVVFTPAPLAIADSPFLTVSGWMRIPDGSINERGSFLFSFAKPGAPTGMTALVQVSWNFTYDIAVQVQNTGDTAHLTASSYDGIFSPNATGHHIFMSVDTNHAAGAKLVNLYLDNINVLNPAFTDDVGPAFNIGFNGCEFGVPSINEPSFLSNINQHFTELWIACGVYLDATNIVKFRDPGTGLPVPLGTHGEIPTGTPPTYFLTGPPAQFQVNAGSGPAVSAAGSLVSGTFNGFLDVNPATVFCGLGGRSGGYAGVFQDPCSASDSPFVTISIWARNLNSAFLNFPNLISLGLNSGSGGSGNSVLLGGNTSGNENDVGCFFAALASPATNQVAFSSGGGKFTSSPIGHHVFISVDTNHPAGAKLLNIYIDGVNAYDATQTLDTGPAFNIGFNRAGLGFFGLPDVDPFTNLVDSDLDFAEVWIACGQYVDPSNIGLFRNPGTGLPVNLGTNGELPTGTPPTYYFKGPSGSFYANWGSGGPVTQYDASASSSGFIAAGAIGDSTWALPATAPPTNTYVAKSVHFAGAGSALNIAAIAAGTDNGFFAFSFWALNLIDGSNDGKNVWVIDPTNFQAQFMNNITPANQLNWQLVNATNTHSLNAGWVHTSGNGARDPWFNTGVWNHYLGSAESNVASTAKIMCLYINDMFIKPDFFGVDAIAVVAALNGKQFRFGDDAHGNGPTIDVADLWLAPNVKLHLPDGTIPFATRRQFISPRLEPVNPAGWPTSAVQCTGDASTFATNLGTGGAITVVGSITNATTFPKIGGKFGATPP